MAKITATFSPDGGPAEIVVSGVKGASCQNASQFLSQALGTSVKDVKTTEFYEEPIKAETRVATTL